MATIYSLICWGGRTGKTVSISASTDVVTSTNHGLRDGTKLWPSGTLPAELNTSTPVYARSTAASTFTLHTSSAGAIANTGNITFAGASTYAAVVLKSDLVADPANALSAYGLSDLSRWGSSGSERIYDGINAARSTRNSVASKTVSEFIEIGQAFTDPSTSGITMRCGACPETTYATTVNGVATPAYHSGIVSSGYVNLISNYGHIIGTKTRVIGIQFEHATSGASAQLMSALDSMGALFHKNILVGKSTSSGSAGLVIQTAALADIQNNLIFGFTDGLVNYNATGSGVVAHNIVTKCANGIRSAGDGLSYRLDSWINNVSVGNTTNWRVQPTSLEYASGNIGEVSNTPWVTSGGVSYFAATTDFADYANNDFSPAASTSPQVSASVENYYAQPTDIADNTRPAYPGALYGTDVTAGSFVAGLSYTIATVGTTDFTAIGASANTVGITFKATGVGSGTGTATLGAKYDAGCYEYDLGYGPWPASHTLTLDNVVVGSRILIRDQADTTTHYSGVAATSTVVIPVTVYSSALDDWIIKIRNATATPFYQPWQTQMTVTEGASSIYVAQIPDE